MIFSVAAFSRSNSISPIEHENKNTARTGVPFHPSPDPLLRSLSNLRVSNVPPPPGGGRSGRRSICGERAAGWLVRLFTKPCRSLTIVRSLFPYRSTGGMRQLRCAPFLSARFLASSVGGGVYRFLSRLVLRLACSSRGASRGYSFDLPVGSSRRARQFARRLVVSSRQAVRILSSRLVVSFLVLWYRVVFSVLFSSHIVRCVS